MTHMIVNHKLGANNEVSLSTVRRSAKQVFGGKCHNRATKKTGSRDINSPWANARLAFALQLQQQFAEWTPGPSMVGKTIVKLFEGKPFVGKITSYDPVEKYYKVLYEDGDQQELEWHELRVEEWPKIDRRQVLWLDEKHKKVCMIVTHTHTHTSVVVSHIFRSVLTIYI